MFLRQPEGRHSIIITFKQLCNLSSSQRDLKRKTPLIQRKKVLQRHNIVCSILSGVKREKLDHWINFKKLKLVFIIKLIKSDSKVIYDIKMYISIITSHWGIE